MAISGANLDVNGIVGQLMSIEQRPLAALNKKEADYQAKISAYGSISGALSSFQTAVQELKKPEKFDTIKATSSDTAAMTASATQKAATGSHSLSVSSLAQAQKLVVAGQESDTANIGTGASTTISFDFGAISGGTFDVASGKYKDATFKSGGQGIKTITIDSSSNTLQGIRDSINSAKIGIKAAIINDGSDAPYALSISSENAGAENSLKISVEGDESLSKLLAHNPADTQNLKQNVAAQNATFMVDGVTVSKPSNTIVDIIRGVTLDLKGISEKPLTLSIANEGGAITTSVQGFVKAYNELNKTLQDLSAFNLETKEGAVLQGDATVRLLQSQLRTILNTPVTNTGSALTTLTQIGISIQKDGSMLLDTSKLDSAIKENPKDVAALFTTVGKSSDPNITFKNANPKTDAGNFPIQVSKLATKGNLASRDEVESLVIEEGENDVLDVNVNGKSAPIVLAPGEYSFDSLANEIQSRINGTKSLSDAGIKVSVKHDENGLTIISNSFGSKSKVDVSGSAALNLFGKKSVNTPGTDVEGTINGTPATGTGQTLTSKGGDSSGISVLVDGGKTGERGKITYSQGYALTLDAFITSVLAKDGQLEGRKAGINSSIKDIDNHRETIKQRLPLQEARYRRQYSSLEMMLNKMGKTSEYLNQQLSNLPRPY